MMKNHQILTVLRLLLLDVVIKTIVRAYRRVVRGMALTISDQVVDTIPLHLLMQVEQNHPFLMQGRYHKVPYLGWLLRWNYTPVVPTSYPLNLPVLLVKRTILGVHMVVYPLLPVQLLQLHLV